MIYKITVERVLAPLEGEKYDREEKIYQQKFEAEVESEMLVKIIDAVNK